MYMDGCSYSDIAKRLNTDGILSPTLQREYYKTGEKPSPESKPWNNYEVKRVLQDVHCTGDSVYGNISRVFFKETSREIYRRVSGSMLRIPTKELLIKNCSGRYRKNPGIYGSIQKKHQLNNGAIRNHNFYTGKIRCGGCGNRMVLSREKQGHFIISVVQMRTINPEEISVRGTESKRIRG